jgi:hypothetical protein
MPSSLKSTLITTEEDHPRIACSSLKGDPGCPVMHFDNFTLITTPKHLGQVVAAASAWLLEHGDGQVVAGQVVAGQATLPLDPRD